MAVNPKTLYFSAFSEFLVGTGAACEVYGALVERLTAKALRQMQHWTDIQVVSEPGGDFRSVRSSR